MDDTSQQFVPGGQSYEADRLKGIHRRRIWGFGVCIALWLLSAVPLALLSSDEGGGAGVAAIYLAAGLAIAVLSRAGYALLTKKPFWSPWLFVIAAVLAIMSYGVQSAGENVASPVTLGVPTRVTPAS
jgi:dipeptide/tripeptide permease